MPSFEDSMNAWLKQIEKVVPNKDQQRKITKAGAEVFQKRLAEVTKAKHYSNKKDSKYGHMADHISVIDKNVDGDVDGSSTAGWTNRYHAMNAMRLNNGTIHIKADHFVDQTRSDVADDVLKAESDTYRKMIGGDG